MTNSHTLLMEAEALRAEPAGAVLLEASMRPVVGAPPAASGTIPGAHLIDLDGVWSDHTSGLPHTLLMPAAFAAQARALGIHRDTPIVVFDRHGAYCAPRLWFNLALMGCEQVRLLNGGVPAWQKAGGALVSEAGRPDLPKVGNA